MLPNVEPLPNLRVGFDSYANIHYGRMRSLSGWQTSRDAVEATLRQWYEKMQSRQSLIDGTPADLKTFLQNLPTADQCDISVVYLGSIQTASAGWEFVNGDMAEWRSLLTTPIPPHPCRIVILDACHAAAVRQIPDWQKWATVTLLAAGDDELTYDFAPSSLRPIDVAQHLPAAQVWGQTHLDPGWDKHISFLGLMWMQSAAAATQPPADASGWNHFFQACQQNAADFRRTQSRRWSSTLQVYWPQ